MNLLPYKILTNQTINRWIYTDVKVEPFQSDKDTFYHEVNLTEEYLQIEYPVRKQFLLSRMQSQIELTDLSFTNIYYPFENPRFEFSSFIRTPHVLSVFAKTYIHTVQKDKLPFTLSTCGSVEVWVNGSKQICYTPYTRNLASYIDIELTFQKGNNEVVIYMDDLAERDVNYYMEMRYTGEQELEGSIPVTVSAEKVKKAESFLASLCFSKDYYDAGQLEVYFNSAFADEFDRLFVDVNRNHLVKPEAGSDYDFQFNMDVRGDNKLTLMPINEVAVNGFTRFDFILVIDDCFEIRRRMTASIVSKDYSSRSFSRELADRKREVLAFFSESENPDLNIGIALTHLTNKVDETVIRNIKSCFKDIESKSDCADFRLAPLLAYIIKNKDIIPADFQAEIEELALNFRYWIDEPGNDVMWYFSENHALLFHISQYLSGYLYPEKKFTVSDRTGREQNEIGRERLEEWFALFFQYGFSEWNSTTYLPIDLIGFFSLYEAAPDQDIRDMAKKALDITFKVIAVNLHGRTMSSTYGRVYEHDLKAMELGEVANLTYIIWGKGYLNRAMRSTALFCISDYIPPQFDQYFIEDDSKALLTQYKQGIKQVYTYIYKTNSYSMSSAIHFNAFHKGHQQHAMNISLDQDHTQVWINHPGELVYSGENRPSFWAGNGISPNIQQYRQYMLMEYKLQESSIGFIHMYLPFWKLDEIVEKDKWLFIKKNKSYLASYFSNGFKRIKEGPVAFREVRSYGNEHKVFITCSSEHEHPSFDEFINEHLHSISVTSEHEWFYENKKIGKLSMNNHELFINHQKIEYKAGYEIESEILELQGKYS